jgi:hypothetical protein
LAIVSGGSRRRRLAPGLGATPQSIFGNAVPLSIVRSEILPMLSCLKIVQPLWIENRLR